MRSEVQVFPDPPLYWGYSSAGRAPALQAGGQEFDPPYLHQFFEMSYNYIVNKKSKRKKRIRVKSKEKSRNTPFNMTNIRSG